MARSKRRAMRANWSPAPAALALSVIGSAETPVRAVAAANRSMAAFAAAWTAGQAMTLEQAIADALGDVG